MIRKDRIQIVDETLFLIFIVKFVEKVILKQVILPISHQYNIFLITSI